MTVRGWVIHNDYESPTKDRSIRVCMCVCVCIFVLVCEPVHSVGKI